jgi:AcrR family transcriptional regulator
MEAASLYNHIASKEDLLAITCFDLANQFEKGILEVNDIYFDAKEKLRMAIEAHTQILTNNLDASYVFLHEWRHLSADKLNEFKQRRDNYENGFIEILKLGENEGVFSEVDEKFVVITILSTLNATIEWYKPNGQLSPKEVSNKLSDFILNGILNSKP